MAHFFKKEKIQLMGMSICVVEKCLSIFDSSKEKYPCRTDLWLTGLDLAKQVNLLLIKHKRSSWIQTSQTGSQWYSNTSPYKVMSVLWLSRPCNDCLFCRDHRHVIDHRDVLTWFYPFPVHRGSPRTVRGSRQFAFASARCSSPRRTCQRGS